jgi:colanic acid biosynthesis glycosyl transferase WcaI
MMRLSLQTPSPSLPRSTGGGRKSGTLLVLSQTFVPDPASVGQHMTDVSVEMARRGYRVRVYASARGYEDASLKYPAREVLQGVEIRRLPLGSLGKKRFFLRVLGTAVFHLQALFAGLFAPRIGGIFFSTSPPLIGVVASIIGSVRRVPVAYWAMDLNPDQLIAIGKLKPTSLSARILEAVNRFILRRSSLIIALDRFMADRILKRGNYPDKMLVMPPWSHDQQIQQRSVGENPFRIRHGLQGKFVIMYSGNHSPSNPLQTLLDAAVRLKDDDRLRFLFVGGGAGKKNVEAYIRDHQLTNVISLPYQPLAELGDSLSAADVHVVSLGENMVGIIHPCKIYGAMAVARPILYFGPRPSHISDLLDRHGFGLQVPHGDVDGAAKAIEQLKATDPAELKRMGDEARDVMQKNLGQDALTARFCDRLENALFEPHRDTGLRRAQSSRVSPVQAAQNL